MAKANGLNPIPTKLNGQMGMGQYLGTQEMVNDSMADKVTELAGTDSKLNQMARTEGLKMANRRGLSNSSMAVGAAGDAVIKNVLPIAQQDAQTAATKNRDAKAFEYNMEAQAANLNGQEKMQIRQIASTEGIAAAQRKLDVLMQEKGFSFTAGQNSLDRALQKEEARLGRALTVSENAKIRATTIAENKLDRAATAKLSADEIKASKALADLDVKFKTGQNALDRASQLKIANMNLNSTDKNAVAQLVSNAQATYQEEYRSIQANTALSSSARTTYLKAAKTRNDKYMSLVEQIYNVNLKF